jgi:aminoglycoside/choline kinase family phosphotransferase
MDLPDASDSRLAQLTRWVFDDLGFEGGRLAPASADASFRRYFRVTRGEDTYIVMDAPPDKEDLGPFSSVARLLLRIGVNVPVILATDSKRGFLLLSDLGVRQYLDELAVETADRLYADALGALSTMQTADGAIARDLPRYSHALLMREMDLMPEWFLGSHLRLQVSAAERGMLAGQFEILAQSALAQPAAFVHRDYHSRNLLVTETDNPGILDFQDAVWGPVTYDLASLLKDCYVAWPAPRVRDWALQYRERLLTRGFPFLGATESEFIRWFDLVGLQRHIKVLGIFARLFYRDGKQQYLEDLPRVLRYARETAGAYAETSQLADFIARRIEPEFLNAQARSLSDS